MSEPLNATERRVYEYLIDFLAEHTYQPSIREIGRRFRIKSTKTVSDVLQSLARKGYIERDPSRSRGVRLVGYSGVGGTQAVPYFTGVAAQGPALAPDRRAGHLCLDRRLTPSGQAFLLRVEDENLTGRGILRGDYVIVDPLSPPSEGGVVAARIAGAATIRPFAPSEPAEVLGSVTGVIRTLGPGDPVASPLVMQTAEVQ